MSRGRVGAALLVPVAAVVIVGAVWQYLARPSAPARRATPEATSPQGGMARSGSPDDPPRSGPTQPGDWFEDVTTRSGVTHTYATGMEHGHLSIIESLGGGVALFDADEDGDLDLFLPGGGGYSGDDRRTIEGRPSSFWRNEGGLHFTDVTEVAGIQTTGLYSHGVAVADYDRDGLDDLVVTGYGGLLLFHNEGGWFTDVTTAAGLAATTVEGGMPAWGTSAAWADFDGDDDADLVVCRYVNWSFATHRRCWYHDESLADVCPPRSFAPLPAALFRNEGDGTFTDVADAVGMLEPLHVAAMKGLGVVAADLDGDRRPDVYMANDTTSNLLFLNRGGRFEEHGVAAGVAHDDRGLANGSMGIAVGDPFGSGRPSLLVTNYQHEVPALYRNDGNGHFTFASRSSGVTAVGLSFVGFGTSFADFDQDGWEDIAIVNGHVIRHPQGTTIAQRPVLARNAGRGRFIVVSDEGGTYFRTAHHGRGLAGGDLDDDGAVDLVVSHVDAPVAVLHNRAGHGRGWIGVDLADGARRDRVGAHVDLECGGRHQHRFVIGGGTYLSHGDRRLLFGLGDDARTTADVTVTWPDGSVSRWHGLAAGRYHRLERDDPAAVMEDRAASR